MALTVTVVDTLIYHHFFISHTKTTDNESTPDQLLYLATKVVGET